MLFLPLTVSLRYGDSYLEDKTLNVTVLYLFIVSFPQVKTSINIK